MAVQKSRKTRSARGMASFHTTRVKGATALVLPTLTTGEVHRRHHVFA